MPEGHAEHPADVAHRRPRLQLAESDDLRHPVGTIFAAHIGDHFVPPVLAEIDVEVRHRHAFRIQEAFEQQAELQRVQIGDGQCPGNHGASARPTAGTNRDPLPFRPLDEVGDDQEVAGETHAGDHVEFKRQPILVNLAAGVIEVAASQPARQPFPRHGADGFLLRLAFVHLRADRQQRLAGFGHHRAAARDGQRVVTGIR